MIKIKYQNKLYTIEKEKMSVKEILKKLNLKGNYVIVLKNNEIVTEDEMIKETDEVEIISAISGGM